MSFLEIKQKHGERFLSMVATEIVIQGLKALREEPREDTALATVLRACFDDIDGSSWDEIRSIIKRSL